jgi:hypothetical protein
MHREARLVREGGNTPSKWHEGLRRLDGSRRGGGGLGRDQ